MSTQEGSAVNKPPLFDGKNYTFWKARMKILLKSLDPKCWLLVEKGFTEPKITSIIGGGQLTTVSPMEHWSTTEKEHHHANARALNAINSGISPEEFKSIMTCETAKEAWDILELAHEGTSQVKNSKLQMLTSQFERMKMEDHETFGEFWLRLQDCTNSMWGLGQQIDDSMIVRKILRSLPVRFDPKVTAIEESKNVGELNLKELVGSIQTFELKFAPRDGKANTSKAVKSNALKTTVTEYLEEDIALLVKRMNQMFRRSRNFTRNSP